MKKQLIRIITGVILFIALLILQIENPVLNVTLYVITYIIAGGDIVFNAFRNIVRGKVFDENFLMTVATIGAMVIKEYPEGVAVMLFYQVGELFQSYAVGKSRNSIASLMNIRPDYANMKRGEEILKVSPEDVHIGDTIVIKAGEKIPLDAVITEGSSSIDTSALTGESIPRDVNTGDNILSGSININGLLTARVTKEFGESTVSKILDLVENSGNKKSRSEKFITKFAKYYTPIVVIIAVFLAVLPPLLFKGEVFSDWVYRALSFLVVSCPCALVISIPLSFFGGIGGASKKGILVKGGNYLEALAKTDIVVFDKTGTLTKGVFNVHEINPVGVSEDELLEIAAYAESYSNHPISLSLKKKYNRAIDSTRITDVNEIPGHGVIAYIDNRKVLAGNSKLMNLHNINYVKQEEAGTSVHVAINDTYAGYILISDELKEDSEKAIKGLKENNIKKTVMLTGDNMSAAKKVAEKLGITEVYHELLPQEKVDKVEELLKSKNEKETLVYVGDGINDAPVLARADIGIAMGGLGSDSAIEAADIVIMTDEPSKISTAINIAKKTLRIANQNIVLAIGVKVIVLVLSGIGLTTMWAAIFGDVGVTIIAVLNSFRALNVKNM